jgi:2-iminobutanoate/2-iminopropanoate deaminase
MLNRPGAHNRATLRDMRSSMLRTSAVTALFTAVLSAQTAKTAKKQFLNLDGQKPPGYTHVVTSAPGRMIFISGRGGTANDGSMPADFATQATNTFEDLKRCLALAGASFKDVVKINYFIGDLSNTAELRKVRAKYLNMDAPPAATLVQAGLGGGLLLEVEAVAMLPE